MNRTQAIGLACRLQALVSHSLDDYRNPADCFCGNPSHPRYEHYRNAGVAFKFIRDAVVEKMARDGIALKAGTLAEVDSILRRAGAQ